MGAAISGSRRQVRPELRRRAGCGCHHLSIFTSGEALEKGNLSGSYMIAACYDVYSGKE